MPRARGPQKVAKAAGPKACNLAEKFPLGTVLTDLYKKQWRLGPVIGQGGFGLIYLAAESSNKEVNGISADHVVKIEPKQNGPLYCEMQFYQRVAKQAEINAFKSSHRLRYLSIPPYIATGHHIFNHREYRFLVMPRFGTDLQKLFVDGGGMFPAHITFAVALRMIDALHFLHENEYVHADVKAANILTGFSKGAENLNEVYLVDYGLAYRYRVGAEHKMYKEDPRKAHNGTIEFTSRDAHKGVSPSRRADMEILGYCLLQWLGGRLPWETHLNNPTLVAADKEKYMSRPGQLVSCCVKDMKTPAAECMRKYLEMVNKLQYEESPDYCAIKALFKKGMEKSGHRDEWTLNFPVKVGRSRTFSHSDNRSPRSSCRGSSCDGRLKDGPLLLSSSPLLNFTQPSRLKSVSPSGFERRCMQHPSEPIADLIEDNKDPAQPLADGEGLRSSPDHSTDNFRDAGAPESHFHMDQPLVHLGLSHPCYLLLWSPYMRLLLVLILIYLSTESSLKRLFFTNEDIDDKIAAFNA